MLVADTEEEIHIDSDFPDEFKGSDDTKRVKGGNVKRAGKGWCRYLTGFALPVVSEGQFVSHYIVYRATLIVRADKRSVLHLYDVINVRKESSVPFEL